MDERAVLIWNPAAGRRSAALADRATRLLAQRGIPTSARPTTRAGDAGAFAQAAAQEGAGLIFALGGDGTHGEVADALAKSRARPRVALLPGGTGNDGLAHFGVASIEEAVERVVRGAERAVDLGRASWAGGGRHFLTILGTGLAADTTREAARFRWLGPAAYTAALPRALARLRAIPTRLTLDGREEREAFSLVAVCNTSRAGGGMRFAPDADASDGAFEIIALREASRARILALLPRLMAGKHLGEPEVHAARASRIVIEPDAPMPAEADGEPVGDTPMTIEVVPRALRLAV